MKLYRHYKNKHYLVRDIARHSETGDEHVVYECRYDTPDKLWIRPRAMFDEVITVDGAPTPRFAEVALDIRHYDQVGPAEEIILAKLIAEILGEWDPDWFHSNLRNHPRPHLQIAFVEGRAVGFKLGYEEDQRTFYSWLGGVAAEFRGLGIAADLMNAQHEWCRANGYRAVRTKSQNRWRGQIILNLRHGFEITGFHASTEGGPKIMLEKIL